MRAVILVNVIRYRAWILGGFPIAPHPPFGRNIFWLMGISKSTIWTAAQNPKDHGQQKGGAAWQRTTKTGVNRGARRSHLADKASKSAKRHYGRAARRICGLVAAVMILYGGYGLYDTFRTVRAASSYGRDLMRYKPEITGEEKAASSGAELEAINQDYRAWLTVYDTNIDYPVVQGKDDIYYASHDFYKKDSQAGSDYLAARNSGDFSDTYNIIYGHHMDRG